MKFFITIQTPIEQRQLSEFAAWYTDWQILPGTYELKQGVNPYNQSKVEFTAKCDAEIVSDNYQSHFGGMPFGSYDHKQNSGKRGIRSLNFTPSQLLTDKRVTISEENYDAILALAISELKYDIEISMSCLSDGLKPRHERFPNLDPMSSMSGHAASLAEQTKLYTSISGVIGRRAYQREKPAHQSGWPDTELHLQN